MKSTLMFVTLAAALTAPRGAYAKSELETLREQLRGAAAGVERTEGHQCKASGQGRGCRPQKRSTAKVSAGSTGGKYIVKAGDSIERIARKAGMSSGGFGQGQRSKIHRDHSPGANPESHRNGSRGHNSGRFQDPDSRPSRAQAKCRTVGGGSFKKAC